MWETKLHIIILIFIFVDRREDKKFGAVGKQTFPELNYISSSSRVKYYFVTVIDKYLNVDTIYKDILIMLGPYYEFLVLFDDETW
jgi:hypothetical protein